MNIMKTYLYNVDPFKPHLYIYSKTGVYRGIYYFSYFCSKHWEKKSAQLKKFYCKLVSEFNPSSVHKMAEYCADFFSQDLCSKH